MSAMITRELLVKDFNSHKFIFVWEDGATWEVADRLKEAYDRLNSLDVSVSWYQTHEPLPSQDAHFPTVYVMNRFDTTLYEEIKEDFRTINPICVITSLSNIVKIPISSCRSLVNMALRKCRVSSTSFSEEQTSLIRERVSLMGGDYTQRLLANTTHLISEQVHSKKYVCAVENSIEVVLCSWLDDAWDFSSSNPNFVAVNPSYTKKHRCPVFMKCNVVVSGFTGNVREEIMNLLKSNRANYTEDLVMNGDSQTTHLVTNLVISDTLNIALKHSIIVVSKDWVTDCVKHAYRLPEENYSLNAKRGKAVAIARYKNNAISDVVTEKLNELDLEVDSCEEFLCGCNIYLCGFTDTQANRIKKFLNLCKATHLCKLNANVTHVVMGCPSDKQSREVINFSPAPSFILKYDWLIGCWKQQSALSESDFIVNIAENDQPSNKVSNKVWGSVTDNELHLPKLSQHTKEEKILSNSYFRLLDPLPTMHDQIKRIIIKNGGNLVTENSVITPDYVIAPLDVIDCITNTTVLVTLYWLESSLFAKRLLEPFENPLFTPAHVFECRNVLLDTSVMVAKERDRYIKSISIEQFLNYMGARVTNTLIDIVHVVISDDPNHKFSKKAKELDIPVVRLKWVIQCAQTNTKLPFTDYYTYPSSQFSKSPPVFISSLPTRGSSFECDPAFELDFEDSEGYFPRGTTPKTAPRRSRGEITQLAQMYTNNMESLGTRNFSAKRETPEPFHLIDVISDNLGSGVLVGTKIAFSNRFTAQEITQMVNIVNELGGVYCNPYTPQVTHYIYSAKSNWSKEALLAKKGIAVVVHPQWLIDIKRSEKRLDVINYPPSFDPDNSIGCIKVEKCDETERRDAWELIHATQSPSNRNTFDQVKFHFNEEPADNTGNTSMTVDYYTSSILSENVTHSRGKKRLRSPITPIFQNPNCCNRVKNIATSKSELNTTDNETTSEPIEEIGQYTQEVYDTFDNYLRELNEAEKKINKPHDRLMIGLNSEFKVPSEPRRFSGLLQQKKYLLEHHSELCQSRAKILWGPEEYSPLPNFNPEIIDNIYSSSTPEHSHSYEEISNESRSSILQRSGCWKTDSNSPSNSSLYPSQHPSHIFMFSSIEMELRIRLADVIQFLGGKYFSELSYEQHCTHLITGEVTSNEKLFYAMAAGLYILKPEYIFKCQSVSKFVEAEPFEWGNPSTNASTSKPIQNHKRLFATYWWRKKLEERVQKNKSRMSLRNPPKTGVFEGWSVYLGCQNCNVKECKIKFCKHIIRAGRGKTTYSANQRSNLTIAIMDLHSISKTILQMFKKSGTKVVTCEYLIEYLDNLGDEMQLKRCVLQQTLP